VLNASRHHSNEHTPRHGPAGGEQARCSTPHGITATSTTCESPQQDLAHQVLNASRHHSNEHPRVQHCRHYRSRVLNASRHHSNEHNRNLQVLDSLAIVLNASRHHSNEHSPTTPTHRPSPVRGAQRLTASQQRAHRNLQVLDSLPIVLNASRHHSNEHMDALADEHTAAACSTPHGITATSTGVRAAEPRERRLCSTPHGITATSTRTCSSVGDVSETCSTPHGITATSTPRPAGGRLRLQVLNASRHHSNEHTQRHGENHGEAQVLNASRHHSNEHPHHPQAHPQETPIVVCSTPHGITATSTASSSPRARARRVLNASRHHSNEHVSLSRCDLGVTSRAQRLTASQQRAPLPLRRVSSAASAGAQRLTASQQRAPRTPQEPPKRGLVLNASRHHSNEHSTATLLGAGIGAKCSTPHGITATSTWVTFPSLYSGGSAQRLTASQQRAPARWCCTVRSLVSAQRLTASQQRAPLPVRTETVRCARCSTPHGITATSTAVGGAEGRAGLVVLNASRHHSNEHLPVQPVGACRGGRAQRLTASQQRARCTCVVYALRIGCAQRLTASQQRALGGHGRGPPSMGKVLNASRHHSNEHPQY